MKGVNMKYFLLSKRFIILLILLSLYIPVSSQNNKPVAKRDTVSTLCEVPVIIKPLMNDYDPDGDSIAIHTVLAPKNGKILSRTDTTITYVSYYYTGLDSMKYYIKDNTGKISDPVYIVVNVKNNPDLPYAYDDSASIPACDSLIINVLRNDVDPNGDSLEIDPTFGPTSAHMNILKRLNDSLILYRSVSSFTGTDNIYYRVRKKTNISFYSNKAKVVVDVTKNPELPIARNDTVQYLSYSQLHFFPLQNDLLPTSDSNFIKFGYPPPQYLTILPDLSLIYNDTIQNSGEPLKIPYYIQRKNDPVYSSNTAYIFIRYENNPQFFYARPDTLFVDAYGVLIHDIVANDFNPRPQYPLYISSCSNHGLLADSIRYTNRLLKYYPGKKMGGTDVLLYEVKDAATSYKKAVSKVYVEVRNKNTAYLDINNIRARFNACGLQFMGWEKGEFEVPKGSGKISIFANSLWVAGRDHLDSLHFAGERYRQGPYSSWVWTKADYFVGPVMHSTVYGDSQDSTWNYIWRLNKADIEYHRNHYQDLGYQPIQDILTWPGNGNTTLGQATQLAPFYDLDKDGVYEPMNGDYPAIRGDQSLFFIFNDDRNFHSESQGEKLGIEIQGLAYAFDMPEDTAFNNTIFLHYTVINRSQETYSDTWFGAFTDIDLGFSGDDFIGCDVERNMYFCHNGDSLDGNGQSNAYDLHPPAQGVLLLAGPEMDGDGMDNKRFDENGDQICDESVNGLLFGDNIIDNERFGMKKFNQMTYFYSVNPSWWDYNDFYLKMMGLWADGTHLMYGGYGHPGGGAYGPECEFIYPGESDSLNWGVGCNPPNGPVEWTEETIGSTPGDRRGVATTGPFTFKPGDKQEIDLAFPWARDYNSNNPLASVDKLRIIADRINKAFAENRLPNGDPIYSVYEISGSGQNSIRIYPNPAASIIHVSFNGFKNQEGLITLWSLDGRMVKSQTCHDLNHFSMNVQELPTGFYILALMATEGVAVSKVLIAR